MVRKQSYSYAYSFNGKDWQTLPITLDAAIISDDYVRKSSGRFFTGGMVGLAAVDCTGFNLPAEFDFFDYSEINDN